MILNEQKEFRALTLALFALLSFDLVVPSEHALADDRIMVLTHPRWLEFGESASVFVTVADEIKDGCWTNSQAALNAVKLELSRSGFVHSGTLTDSSGQASTFEVELSGIGYETTSSVCAVNISLKLGTLTTTDLAYGEVTVTGLFQSTIDQRNMLLTGSKARMNQRIRDSFVEMIQSILLDSELIQAKMIKSGRLME